MPTIPNNISFIWIGTTLPTRHVNAVLDWALQNPQYDIYLWTETPRLDLYMQMFIEGIQKHMRIPPKSQIITEEIEGQRIITVASELVPVSKITLRTVSEVEALCDPTLLVEQITAWKNYASASDLLRLWVLHQIGGVYMDFDVYPVQERLPLNINALEGLLFMDVEGVPYVFFTNSLIAGTPNNPKIRSLCLFFEQCFGKYYPPVRFERGGIYSSGIRRVRTVVHRRVNTLNEARYMRDILNRSFYQQHDPDSQIAREFPPGPVLECPMTPQDYSKQKGELTEIIAGAVFRTTQVTTGPEAIRRWIAIQEEREWVEVENSTPGHANMDECEKNSELSAKYSWLRHVGFLPRQGQDLSWIRSPYDPIHSWRH